jgi:hypothetical protein
MDIISAIKSGKRYKRAFIHKDWYNASEKYLSFTKESLMATDWEIEEERIEITEDMLIQVLDGVQLQDAVAIFNKLKELSK